MKKTVLILLVTLSLLSQSVFAFELRAPRGQMSGVTRGENDIFFEDFTSYDVGANPSKFIIKETAKQIVEVAETMTPDGEKNVLMIKDTDTGGANLTLPIPQINAPLVMEMRMKSVRTTTEGFGLQMHFQDDEGNNAFRMMRFTDVDGWYQYINAAGSTHLTWNANHDNEWFTLKIRMDPASKQTSIIILNDQIKTTKLNFKGASGVYQDFEKGEVMACQLPWFTEFEGAPTKFLFAAYGKTHGEFYIDYIKFTKDVPDFKHIKVRAEAELTPDFYSDPKERLLPYELNVIYKGEIKYFANKPVIVNGRAMIDADSFADWFGTEVIKNNEMYEFDLDGKKLSFKESDIGFYIDGNTYTADTPPEYINGFLYIPLRSFATALGNTVLWQDNPQCVEIK